MRKGAEKPVSNPTLRFLPGYVECLAKGIGVNVYECASCKKLVYPTMEITPDGELLFETEVSELRGGKGNSVEVGNLCSECAEKYRHLMRNHFETSGTIENSR